MSAYHGTNHGDVYDSRAVSVNNFGVYYDCDFFESGDGSLIDLVTGLYDRRLFQNRRASLVLDSLPNQSGAQ
jgi:hypothetical protein